MSQASLFTMQELAPDAVIMHGLDPRTWFTDIPDYLEKNRKPPALPDASEFSREALCDKLGMEWLAHVETILISPLASADDPDSQWAQLSEFTAHLLREATYALPKDAFPSSPDYEPCPVLAIDTETTGLDLRTRFDAAGRLETRTKIVGVTVAPSPAKGYYLPVRNTGEDGVPNWRPDVVAHWLGLLNRTFLSVWHNAGYDLEVEALNGVTEFRPFPYCLDTQVCDFLHDPNANTHGLKDCSERYLGRRMIEIAELFVGFGGIKANAVIMFEDLSASQALVYACSDSMNTMALLQFYASQPASHNLFTAQTAPTKIDQRAVNTIRSMVRTGLPVNYLYFWFAAKDAIYRQILLEDLIYREVGREFTIGSQPQLNQVLFEQFKIPPLPEMERERLENEEKLRQQGKLRPGQKVLFSLKEEVLDKLYLQYPDYKILSFVVTYRKLQGVIAKVYLKGIANSYVDSFLPWTRVQPKFSQTTAATGRLSSSSSDGMERVTVKETSSGVSRNYTRGSGDAGWNSQGLASAPFRTAKARAISRLPAAAGIDPANPYPQIVEQEFIKGLARL